MIDEIQYPIRRVNQNPELMDGMKVLIKHCRVCIVVFPLLALIAYIPLVYIVVFQSSSGIAGYMSVLFFCIFTLVVFFVFWFAIRGDRFIIAADNAGFYYRSATDKDIYILIPWGYVSKIEKYSIDGREVNIFTSINGEEKLPKPCNGNFYLFDNGLRFEFFPGLNCTDSRMMRELNDVMCDSIKHKNK